jgi:hypothetical protein
VYHQGGITDETGRKCDTVKTMPSRKAFEKNKRFLFERREFRRNNSE